MRQPRSSEVGRRERRHGGGVGRMWALGQKLLVAGENGEGGAWGTGWECPWQRKSEGKKKISQTHDTVGEQINSQQTITGRGLAASLHSANEET